MTSWHLIFAVATTGVGIYIASRFVQRLTVFEYQHALLFNHGRYARLLKPGLYWLFKPKSMVEVIDSRPRVLTIPGQEVLSADGVSLKVSVLIQFQVCDPKTAKLEFENYEEALYARVQTVLREAIGEKPIDNILESRTELSKHLHSSASDISTALGLKIDSISVKDIMFPGSLKDAFSQVARAKQEGLAVLERARGETAAMRNLANTAKMIDGNPNLYQLRLLQTISDASSVVLRLDNNNARGPDVGIDATE